MTSTALNDFARKYHAIRAMQLAAKGAAAAAQGDHELAALYLREADRTIDILQPPHLKVLPSAGSTASS